jgi:hypothetical protein
MFQLLVLNHHIGALLMPITQVCNIANTINQAKLSIDSIQSSTIISGTASLVAENFIHFLQSQALGLWHHEEDKGRGQVAHDAEEDECAVTHVLDHIGSSLSDGKVVEPVAGCADGDTLGTNSKREDFGHKDPCSRLEKKKEKLARMNKIQEYSRILTPHEKPKQTSYSQTQTTATQPAAMCWGQWLPYAPNSPATMM